MTSVRKFQKRGSKKRNITMEKDAGKKLKNRMTSIRKFQKKPSKKRNITMEKDAGN